MLGWFTVAVAGVVVAVLVQSNAEKDCSGLCFSDRIIAIFLAVVVGFPSLIVAALVGEIVLRVLARRGWTGAVAGSVAAVAGLVTGPIVVLTTIAVYLAVKRA